MVGKPGRSGRRRTSSKVVSKPSSTDQWITQMMGNTRIIHSNQETEEKLPTGNSYTYLDSYRGTPYREPDERQQADQALADFEKLRRLQDAGYPSHVLDQIARQYGIEHLWKNRKGNTPVNNGETGMSFKDMMETAKGIEDPETKMMAMAGMSGNSQILQMVMAKYLFGNNQNKGNSELDIITKLKELGILNMENKNSESEIDKLVKLKELGIINLGNNNAEDSIDKLIERKQKMIEAGLVEDKSSGGDDPNLTLRLEEMEHEKEMEERREKRDYNSRKMMMKGFNQGLNVVGSALSYGLKGTAPPKSQDKAMHDTNQGKNEYYDYGDDDEQDIQYEDTHEKEEKQTIPRHTITCKNPSCNSDFPIALDSKKIIECPHGCGFKYVIDHPPKDDGNPDTSKLGVFQSTENKKLLQEQAQEEPQEESKKESGNRSARRIKRKKS